MFPKLCVQVQRWHANFCEMNANYIIDHDLVNESVPEVGMTSESIKLLRSLQLQHRNLFLSKQLCFLE